MSDRFCIRPVLLTSRLSARFLKHLLRHRWGLRRGSERTAFLHPVLAGVTYGERLARADLGRDVLRATRCGETEKVDHAIELPRLPLCLLDRSIGFFHQRRVVLGHFVHLADSRRHIDERYRLPVVRQGNPVNQLSTLFCSPRLRFTSSGLRLFAQQTETVRAAFPPAQTGDQSLKKLLAPLPLAVLITTPAFAQIHGRAG